MAGRPVHTFEVVRSEQLAPHLVRVILGGGGFDTFKPNDFTDAYVKIVFVSDGVDVHSLPQPLTLDSFKTLPTEQQPVVRTYTVRCVDEDRREVAIDFVVHGDHGVAGPWAVAAIPGQPAYLMGPSGAYAPDPAADWHLLAGDEAGLPAIGAALEALPDNAIGKVFIEVGGPDDEIPLTAPPGVEVNWIYRDGRADLVPEDQAGENAPLIAAMKEGRLAAWAGAGLHPRRGAGRHAQPAPLRPQKTRHRRQVGVVHLWILAPRPHRGDISAVEGRIGEGRSRRVVARHASQVTSAAVAYKFDPEMSAA